MKNIDPEYQKIGRRIRAIRVEKNMAQEEVADRLGILPVSLNNIETGKTALRVSRLFQLREILGCSARDIFEDSREGAHDIPEVENYQDIGRRVSSLRMLNGMAQTELAEKMGITVATVHTIEHGEREVTLKSLLKLRELLGCTMCELFEQEPSGEEPTKPCRKTAGPEFRKISRRIQKLRTAKGMTLTELARAIDISLGNLSKIESGKNEPPLKNLFKIRKVLGCSMSDFFEDRHERETRPPELEMCENIQFEYQKIGRRIRAIRSDRKITRAELADRIGVTLPCIRKIESGREKIRLKRLFRISEILGCPMKDLFETPTKDHFKTVEIECQKIGSRIRHICGQRNTNRDELAAHMGITPDTLAEIEDGREEITLENLFKIRRFLGCAMGDFFDERTKSEIRIAEVIRAMRVVKKTKAQRKT